MIWLPKDKRPPEEKLQWHRKFAWFPTITHDDAIVWLEDVEQRMYYSSFHDQWLWTYRIPKEKN